MGAGKGDREGGHHQFELCIYWFLGHIKLRGRREAELGGGGEDERKGERKTKNERIEPPSPAPCLWPWGDRDMGRGGGRARRKERELEEREREKAEGPSVLIMIYLPISSPWHCTQRGGGGAEGYGEGEITTHWWGRGRGGTVRGRDGGGERGGDDWFSTSSPSPFPSPSASPHCHPLRV